MEAANVKERRTGREVFKKLSVAEARESLAELINGAAYAGQRSVIMRRGKEVAAIVPIKDLEVVRLNATPDQIHEVQQKDETYTWTNAVGLEGETIIYGGQRI